MLEETSITRVLTPRFPPSKVLSSAFISPLPSGAGLWPPPCQSSHPSLSRRLPFFFFLSWYLRFWVPFSIPLSSYAYFFPPHAAHDGDFSLNTIFMACTDDYLDLFPLLWVFCFLCVLIFRFNWQAQCTAPFYGPFTRASHNFPEMCQSCL